MERLVLALTTAIVACACSGAGDSRDLSETCPHPSFTHPAAASALGPGPSLTVHWDATDDPLPPSYWGSARFQPPLDDRDLDKILDGVTVSGPHELRLGFHPLDEYLSTHDAVSVRVNLGDPRHYVTCHHPGMDDAYHFEITLTFDKGHHFVSATVSPMTVELGAI